MINKLKAIKGIIKTNLGIPTPIFCQWEITHRCNMVCSFCPLKTDANSLWNPEIDTQGANAILKQLSELGVVILNISGGEPLLRDDLGYLITKAKSYGINVFVATNGWLIKEKIESLKDAYAIRVSLDGIGAFHDQFRIKGSYNKALEGIKILIENDINVAINSVITSKTPIEQVIGLCELAKELDVQISIGNCQPSLPARKDPDVKDILSIIKLLGIDNVKFVALKRELKQKYGSLMADPPIFEKIFEKGGLDRFGCKASSIDVSLKPDGSIAMPCAAWGAMYKKGSLKEIWNSKEADKVRKMVGKYPFCKNCRIRCHVFSTILTKPIPALQLLKSYKI